MAQITVADGGSVQSTAGHPFYVSGRGFTPARDLKPGDQIAEAGSGVDTVKSIVRIPGAREVYNLDVAGDHTYFVGADHLWVHNSCGGEPGEIVDVPERMSQVSAEYQERVAGLPAGQAYLVNGVRFDGFQNGVLLEAKGNYDQFIGKGGTWKWWFDRFGLPKLLKQARNQFAAAGGREIEWRFMQERSAGLVRDYFEGNGVHGIRIVHMP